MRTPETVLGMLQKRGEQRKPVHDLYRQLYNPLLYEKAYERIYANQGAMTCGASKETADGMSRKKIQGIIDHIRRESYRWTPARRIFIPKKNGKKRPLGLTTWSDKLVQEVIRLLLEAYYEPQFSEHSHGFRPKRGCHTALAHIQHAWSGVHWYIEGDISQCFDRLDHDIMLKILGRSITDQRFLRLIKHLLQAGYLEEWQYHCTHSGTPQGGVLSPLLANIYLNEIDHYVKEHLLPNYTRGKFRKENLAYQRLMKQSRRLHQQGEHQQAKQLKRQAQHLPSKDPNDPDYRRLHYVRYADDILFGFIGPKSEAQEIKNRLGNFLHDDLKLELSQEKTLITHAQAEAASFLGYHIVARTCKDKMTNGRRSLHGSIRLRVPPDVVEKNRAPYRQGNTPTRRKELLNRDVIDIMRKYQDEYRGLVQYYLLADNVHWLDRLRWDMQRSLLYTLASKYRTSVRKIVARYETTIDTSEGKRKCLQAVKERGDGKNPLVGRFGGIPLKRRKKVPVLINLLPTKQPKPKEIIRRLRAGRCELCGKEEECEVHQERKLADLHRFKKDLLPRWAMLMKKRRRKTLVVCPACHHLIHHEGSGERPT